MAAPRTDADGVRQAIRALLDAGYTLLQVDNGEAVPVTTMKQAVDEVMATDTATLYVRTPLGDYDPWVVFVLGNSEPAKDLLADWSTRLSVVLDPLTKSWGA